MSKRVVVTGMGVCAPNAIGLDNFSNALKNKISGIKEIEELKRLGFACTLGGIPPVTDEIKRKYLPELTLKFLTSSAVTYACIAGVDAWLDAGLKLKEHEENTEPYWNAGTFFGTGIAGAEPLHEAFVRVDDMKVRRLGSRVVEQSMGSAPSAYLAGIIGLGNKVSSNSSACSTGTESILDGYEYIRSGRADIMLCGSTDCDGPYIWGGFDAMWVTNRKMNEDPEGASRPMSATAAGFVPGSGSGALVLEDLEHAKKRGARIYAEILGGAINNGGQRQGGTMTYPNNSGIRKCISEAIKNANIKPGDIDLICGHLTATMGDPGEIKNWSEVLGLKGKNFPYINTAKSLIGHCLAGAGSIESVAAILQMRDGFIHGNKNSEDIHPDIEAIIDRERVPVDTINRPLNIIGKSSFGFGDVNAVMFFSKF
jgi:3-oxoacyl-[acyl-carrier-protein] synthase-1